MLGEFFKNKEFGKINKLFYIIKGEVIMILEKTLEICKFISVCAGKKIMEIYNNKDLFSCVEYKHDNSPLTIADKCSNDIIINKLKKEFPHYAILSEEEKDNKSRLNNDYCFVVDPLDGTKEFMKRNGQFTVNIALSYCHRVVMGVIYVPTTEDLYYASSGIGSYLQQKDGTITKLHVSTETNINKIRLVMSSSHGCKEMDELISKYLLKNFIKMGSSLKGCLVARGDAEVYYRYNPTMEWDTAAMQCIAEEAGVIFRQMDDSEMLYNRENSLNDKGFYIINDKRNRI